MAKRANLWTPHTKEMECAIEKEAKAVEDTIEQMKRDGEEDVGLGWMRSKSVYYSPEQVPFS